MSNQPLRAGLFIIAGLCLSCPSRCLRQPESRSSETKTPLEVELPTFEKTTREIDDNVARVMADTKRRLIVYQRQQPEKMTFQSVIDALTAIERDHNLHLARYGILAGVSPEPKIRRRAARAVQELTDNILAIVTKETYDVLLAYRDKRPSLTKLQQRDLELAIHGYRSGGLSLKAKQRKRVRALFSSAGQLGRKIRHNISERHKLLSPTSEYDEYRKLCFARSNESKQDLPLIAKLVAAKDERARLLGFDNAAEFQMVGTMARTPSCAREFLLRARNKLTADVAAERSAVTSFVRAERQDDQAVDVIDYWYYALRYEQKKLGRSPALLDYFPIEQTVAGILASIEKLLSVSIEQNTGGLNKPHPDVRLYLVRDAAKKTVLGGFYFDAFARTGKDRDCGMNVVSYAAIAKRPLRVPIAYISCSLEPRRNSHGDPSLSLSDIKTLYHELGHVLYHILSARKTTFTPPDFSEVPSMLMEKMSLAKEIIVAFAKNRSGKTPPQTSFDDAIRRSQNPIDQMLLILESLYALDLYSGPPKHGFYERFDRSVDAFLFPVPKAMALAASNSILYGHYDSLIYCYVWAKAIVNQVMAKIQTAPRGFLDPGVGRRLRRLFVQSASDPEGALREFLGTKAIVQCKE